MHTDREALGTHTTVALHVFLRWRDGPTGLGDLKGTRKFNKFLLDMAIKRIPYNKTKMYMEMYCSSLIIINTNTKIQSNTNE